MDLSPVKSDRETTAAAIRGVGFKYIVRPGLVVIPLLVLTGFFMSDAETSVQKSGADSTIVRSCEASSPIQQGKSGQSKRTNKKNPGSIESATACIEIRAGVLPIQEYLQAWVRSMQWAPYDEQTTENSWDFSRKLGPDDLMRFTRPDRRPPRIEWQSGNASIHITTTESDSGFVRTTVRAQIRGIGENKDKLATPHEWYQLDSNGKLESSLVAALKEHFDKPKK